MESKLIEHCFGRSREISIRGWDLPNPNEHKIIPSISEITSTFCKSKRDVYIKYILELEAIPSKAMTLGGMCHSIIADIFKKGKDFQEGKISYEKLTEYCEELKNDRDKIEEIIWEGNQLENLKKWCDSEQLDYESELESMITWLQSIIEFEISRIQNNWKKILNKQFKINMVEDWADGAPLETRWGRIDFIGTIKDELIIFDLKTGSSYGDNRDGKLQIAAYALALEKSLKKEINVGCLVFPLRKSDKTPLDEPVYDYFLITDNLRNEFFTRRDNVYEILKKQKDPKIIDSFPCKWCGYNDFCNKRGGVT